MKRIFRVTALALIAAFMIESDAQAAFAAGAPDADQTFEASDYEWTGDEAEESAVSTESAEELESRYAVSDTEARKPFGVGNVSATQVVVAESADPAGLISVTNNADMELFVAPFEQSLASSLQTASATQASAEIAWVGGTSVMPGETKLLYSGYYKGISAAEPEKKNLEKGASYIVYASTFRVMGIGYSVYPDEVTGKTKIYWDEDVTVITKTPLTLHGEYDKKGLPKAGSEIKFKAVSQKNGNVKLSWSPKSNLGYKKYNLFRLNENTGTAADEWYPLINNKKKTKKYTDTKATDPDTKEVILKNAVYKLVCYDKNDGELESYIAVATPRLYYAETGYSQDNAEFCISGYMESDDLAYVTMTAANKNSYKANTTLPKPAETVTGSYETGYAIDYYVSTNASVRAVRPYHYIKGNGDVSQIELGKNAVYRAKTRYSYKGQEYESGLSNAISRKVGPEKCYISSISGVDPVEYEKHTDPDTGLFVASGAQTAHYDSEGTCYKKGYITFYGVKGHKDVTRYELLARKNTQYGSYKVVKKYTNMSKVNSLSPEDGLYYVEYNKFPPEQDWYYAIRAVYGKKATGGFGDGYYNRTEFEQVQSMVAWDTGKGSCKLAWLNDKCAKEYWIYRADGDIEYDRESNMFYKVVAASGGQGTEGETAHTDRTPIGIDEGLRSFTYVGKVKGSKTKKYQGDDGVYNEYTDKKKLNVNQEYTWIVRPVFNTSAKNKPLKVEMLSYMSDTSSASPSIVLEQASSVKVSRYSIGQLRVSWSKIKKVKGYEVQWTSNKDYLLAENADTNIDNWEKTPWVSNPVYVEGDKTSCVIDVEPGVKYWFRVRGYVNDRYSTDPRNWTCWDELSFGKISKDYRGGKNTANGKSAPMPVKTLKVTRLSGDYYHRGGKISLELNDNDRAWLKENGMTGSMRYTITYEDSDKNSGKVVENHKLDSASGATYSDEERNLARGITRRYSVKLLYNTGGGKYVEGETKTVNYSKPKGLFITDTDGKEISAITLAPDNSEYTFRVYAYTDQDKKTGSQATVRDLSRCDSFDTDIVKIVNRNDNSGYTTVTIKAAKAGTTKLKIDAFDSGWKDGADGDNLQKTLTVTVK